jgi:hypothetical protein
MTNRVDELESQVEKLQATVNGLTEELVEAKERIRLLEESVDVDLTTGTRSVGHDPDSSTERREREAAKADEAAVTASGGSDPLAESQAQTASRSRTSDAPSDDASFVDARSSDAGSVGGSSDATEASTATPDADGTKSDGDDTDDVTVEDDDIIVA